MKQFKTVLKVKQLEETQILEELTNINDKISKLQNKIDSIELQIKKSINNINNSDSNSDRFSLIAIVEILKEDWRKEEHEKYLLLQQSIKINQDLVIKRQEIKAIELIIERKINELKAIELKKEQDILDELNIADY